MTTFISYSRINSDFAVRLAQDLKSAGFDVWLDQLNIPTGARWDDEIEKALERSDIFMIVLSPESIQSQNVKDEISYALDAGKNILPVVIKNCTVPLRLRRFQYVDFTGNPYEDSFVRIKSLLVNTGKVMGENRHKFERESRSRYPEDRSATAKESFRQEPISAQPRQNRGLLFLFVFSGFALVALVLFMFLFKNGLSGGQAEPTSGVPIATSPAADPMVTVVTDTPVPVDTVSPNPKLRKENLTNILMSGSFEKALRNLAAERYSGDDYVFRAEFTYTISLDRSEDVVWHWHWCARDEAVLIRNFEYISVNFTLNGQEIPLTELTEDQYLGNDSACRVYYVTLYDWPAGTHHLVNNVTFTRMINDGWDDYPAQTRVYDYLIYVKP